MSIKGKRNGKKSWEKQTVYNLSNGCTAIIEWSPHYGDFLSRIDKPDGAYWHCSNGISGLPEFAKHWIQEICNAHGVIARLVRPNFKKL